MDNSMQNMLDMYLFETNSLIEQLDGILLDAEQEDSFSEDTINEIFRIMHTIKGSSAMMELDSLKTCAHKIEDLFFFIRENGMNHEHSRDLFNMLFAASDFLKEEIEKLQNGEPLSADFSEMIGKIEGVLALLSGGGGGGAAAEEAGGEAAPAADSVAPAEALKIFDENYVYGIKVMLEDGLGMENLRAFMLVDTVKEVCDDFRFYPEDVETNTDTSAFIVENGFTFSFQNEDMRKVSNDVLKDAINVKSVEDFEQEAAAEVEAAPEPEPAPAPAPVAAAPEPAPAPAAPAPAAPAAAAQKADKGEEKKKEQHAKSQSIISVNLSKLDTLMDIVGEIVITESMVISNPDIADLKSDSFTKAARQLRKLTDDLQDTAMSIRMVPISSTFQKMSRIVRDMSVKLNRPAKLVTEGADTEVDKTIIDNIGDPIMHMVRNSMDHGIEANTEDRIKAGKPAEGTVTLSAQHTGSEVIIKIADDGAGVSSEGVLNKAERNGLLTKPRSEYTRKEILNLLLMPGFSTNEAVTEYSGRGVGMDVVKKNIEKVGGTISMTSEEGEGMETILKIPLTMAIVDGMQVTCGDLMFTVPIANIRQSFKIKESEIVYDEARGEMVQREDGFYPVVKLSDFYGIETDVHSIDDGTMMWVEAGEKSFCMFVDKLLGKQQVVVKAMPPFLNDYDCKGYGISGCSIMGDGNITIILDPPNMYDAAITNSDY